MQKGIVGNNKEEGERGQPCLTPLVISIQSVRPPPKKGVTLPPERDPLTKFCNQLGNFALAKMWWIQSWSIESQALAVSNDVVATVDTG